MTEEPRATDDEPRPESGDPYNPNKGFVECKECGRIVLETDVNEEGLCNEHGTAAVGEQQPEQPPAAAPASEQEEAESGETP